MEYNLKSYIPSVIQVIPDDGYLVYVYFDDWSVKLYDASDLVTKGIFKSLQDINIFKSCITVLNGTLAWDLEGNYDAAKCLDLDPVVLYNTCPNTEEPWHLFKL